MFKKKPDFLGVCSILACVVGAAANAAHAQDTRFVPINPRPNQVYQGVPNSNLGVTQTAQLPGQFAQPGVQTGNFDAYQSAGPGVQPGTTVFAPQQPVVLPGNQYVPYPQTTIGAPGQPAYGVNNFNAANPMWGQSQPMWTGQVNALYMRRSSPSSFPILMDSGGRTLFPANELKFGWDWGFDVALSRRFANDNNFEVRYFQVDPWSAVGARTAPPLKAGGAVIGTGGAVVTTPPSFFIFSNASYFYTTELQSFEMNYVWRFSDRFRVAAGFRYLEVDEFLGQTFAGTAVLPPLTWDIDTDNHMYGFQIGSDARLTNWQRLNFATYVKAGVYGNVADQSTVVSSGGGIFAGNQAASRVASFAGEAGFTGEYAFGPRLSLVGGYQFMWISGVALAADQIPHSTPFGQSSRQLDMSDTFYHGVFFGLEFRWLPLWR